MFRLKINFYAVISLRDWRLSLEYQHFFRHKNFRPSKRKAFVKKEWEFIRGLVLPNKLKYFNILHFKGKMRYMTPKTIKIQILCFIIYYQFERKSYVFKSWNTWIWHKNLRRKYTSLKITGTFISENIKYNKLSIYLFKSFNQS